MSAWRLFGKRSEHSVLIVLECDLDMPSEIAYMVTPSFLERIKGEGVADKELSALLARDLLVPIVHNTTFEDLREVSPLLGSRSGLSTIEDSMEDVAAKIAELVTIETDK